METWLFPEDVQHGCKPLLNEKSDELGVEGLPHQRSTIAIILQYFPDTDPMLIRIRIKI
jgi:hypothetical protein